MKVAAFVVALIETLVYGALWAPAYLLKGVNRNVFEVLIGKRNAAWATAQVSLRSLLGVRPNEELKHTQSNGAYKTHRNFLAFVGVPTTLAMLTLSQKFLKIFASNVTNNEALNVTDKGWISKGKKVVQLFFTPQTFQEKLVGSSIVFVCACIYSLYSCRKDIYNSFIKRKYELSENPLTENALFKNVKHGTQFEENGFKETVIFNFENENKFKEFSSHFYARLHSEHMLQSYFIKYFFNYEKKPIHEIAVFLYVNDKKKSSFHVTIKKQQGLPHRFGMDMKVKNGSSTRTQQSVFTLQNFQATSHDGIRQSLTSYLLLLIEKKYFCGYPIAHTKV